VLSHVLDVLGPGIDECHILASLHHVRAGIAADCASPDESDFLFGHQCLPETKSA
jgi:hypothetical protein